MQKLAAQAIPFRRQLYSALLIYLDRHLPPKKLLRGVSRRLLPLLCCTQHKLECNSSASTTQNPCNRDQTETLQPSYDS